MASQDRDSADGVLGHVVVVVDDGRMVIHGVDVVAKISQGATLHKEPVCGREMVRRFNRMISAGSSGFDPIVGVHDSVLS